jgi:hypothetical protein
VTSKKIYFDTGIVIDLAKQLTYRERRTFLQSLRRDYACWISPITIHELLAGLAGASDFQSSRLALEILYGTRKRKILRLPSVFICRNFFGTVPFGIEDYTPQTAERWIRVALAAKNKDSLQKGNVHISYPLNRRFGVDLSESKRLIDQVKREQIARIQKLQTGTILPAPPDIWANSFFLRFFKRNGTRAEIDVIKSKLEIVYHLDVWLWSQITAGNKLKAANHTTLVADSLQLYYLADPHHYFLTTDQKLKDRVSTSAQSSRILLWSDL